MMRGEKSNGCTLLIFIIATLEIVFGGKKLLDAKCPFGDNVIKNPARNGILLKVNHVPINMSNFNFASSGLKEEGILRVPGNAGRIKVKNPSFFFLDLKVEITYD